MKLDPRQVKQYQRAVSRLAEYSLRADVSDDMLEASLTRSVDTPLELARPAVLKVLEKYQIPNEYLDAFLDYYEEGPQIAYVESTVGFNGDEKSLIAISPNATKADLLEFINVYWDELILPELNEQGRYKETRMKRAGDVHYEVLKYQVMGLKPAEIEEAYNRDFPDEPPLAYDDINQILARFKAR